MPYAFAVLLVVETNDPRLTEKAIAEAQRSGLVSAFAQIRRAVLQHLPKDVQRLVAIMPVEEAQQLCLLHEAVGEELTGEKFGRPPPEYVPPTRD